MTFNEIVKEKHTEALKKAEKQALDNKCKKLIENSSNQKSEKNYAEVAEATKDQINKNVGRKVLVCKNGIIKINSYYKNYFSKAQAENLLNNLTEVCNCLGNAKINDFLRLAEDVADKINELLAEEKPSENSEEK